MKHFILPVLFVIILLSSNYLKAQNEQGILPTKVYGTSEYGGLPQIFDIKADSRGIIYASNNLGLMELSGNIWKVYKIRNNGAVRSLDINPEGKIFVGGKNEFGYFSTDSSHIGKLKYYSISEEIISYEFGEIRNVICINNKTYFKSKNHIFIWNSDSLMELKSKASFLNLFNVSNKIITSIKKRGYYLVEDSLIESNVIPFTKNSARATLFDEENNLFYSSEKGFYLVSIKKNKLVFKSKFNTELTSLLRNRRVFSLLKISDSLFSVATNKGLYIINKKGNIIKSINTKYGLKSDVVYTQALDGNNTLWLGSENGLAKINILSPTVNFPQKKYNYSGRIEDVIRFSGNLHIITPSGLYAFANTSNIDEESAYNSTSKNSTLKSFRHLQQVSKYKESKEIDEKLFKQLSNSCWDLEFFNLPHKKLLLISTMDFVIGLNTNGSLEKVVSCYPYTSYQSSTDPRRVYIGLDGGIQSVYYSENNTWIDEGTIPGVSEVIRDIQEDKNGNLWMASDRQGIIYIKQPLFTNHKIQNPIITKLGKGLEKGDPIQIQSDDDKLLFASSYGIYRFSWVDSLFRLDSSFSKSINSSKNMIHRISRDKQSNIWTVAIDDKSKISSVYYSIKQNTGTYRDLKVFAKKNEIVYSFFHGDKNICWYGGSYGLSKVNTSKLSDSTYTYYTYLTNVLNNSDTAFGGYYTSDKGVTLTQPESYIKTFDFRHNSFTFYFSSSSPKDFEKLNYNWYLEGYEQEVNWGTWSGKTYKEYTNLNEGSYTFHVRAIDIYGNMSEVTSYQFSITPPWYRTIYAYIASIFFFIAFVWGAIRVSTRSLNRIIKEATVEITKQKDQLEEKNRNIIDSIRYAQRIQEAVIPSDREFKKYFNKSFVLWKPRDIVSGDFYWVAPKHDKVYLAAADSTGHGVPGAFMSIMGIAFLNQILGSSKIKNAAEILNQLRHFVITAINKEQESTANKDGMDIAVCVFDFKKMQIDYSGAYNALYIIRNGELLETKADRMPIGMHSRDHIPFKNKLIDIQKGDKIYTFSDGYSDQFGGPKGKKFMAKRFKRLLLEIEDQNMEKQKETLWQRIIEWRGDIEQLDDIIIIGIEIE
ncbi:MAG: SpoIIE family protein phosphatase [Bacteroidales bacterium]|nr:SpoIIE family protein phosphatase [Bacteroidales bacterium]